MVSLVDTLVDLFGPFDLNPAPDAESLMPAEEWQGHWSDDYEVPDELLAAAAKVDLLKKAKSTGGVKWPKAAAEPVGLDDVEAFNKSDAARRDKFTKTLAWIHSRGKSRTAQASTVC